jgi:hypothetical protein
LFKLRNTNDISKFDYLSKGIPSVLLSNLNGFQFVYDEDLLENSITYPYGDPKNNKNKKPSKSITRKSLEDLKKSNSIPQPEKDIRYLKIEIELMQDSSTPFAETALELGRNKKCFYILTGEYQIQSEEVLETKLELTNRKNGNTETFSEKTSVTRAYQELTALSSKLKKKLFPKELSKLSIQTNEEDALVFLNGVFLGKTPLQKEELPMGKHTLSILKDGFEKLEKTILLSNLEVNQFQFELKKKLKQGKISVYSDPPEAEVFLGNEFLGKTPIENVDVALGQNRLRVGKEDFIEHFQGVEITKDKTLKINTKLKKGNTEEFYRNRLKVFGDYTYFDFSVYSLYSIVSFYIGYRYYDYRAGVQADSIRGQVLGSITFLNAYQNSPQFFTYFSYQKYVIDRNQEIVDRYQNYKLGLARGAVGMLFLTGLFYYLGVENEAFEFAFTPSSYQNQSTEAFIQYRFRF